MDASNHSGDPARAGWSHRARRAASADPPSGPNRAPPDRLSVDQPATPIGRAGRGRPRPRALPCPRPGAGRRRRPGPRRLWCRARPGAPRPSGAAADTAAPSSTTTAAEITRGSLAGPRTVAARSVARAPSSRDAAPARSRHHPSGRAPTTLAASTSSTVGRTRTCGQVSANPGCSGSAPPDRGAPSPARRSRGWPLWSPAQGRRHRPWCTTTRRDHRRTGAVCGSRAGSSPASSTASRSAAATPSSWLSRAPPGRPQVSPWWVHAARCWSRTRTTPASSTACSSRPAAPCRPQCR